ncbi:hypothetical protein MIND_00994300 [Mycena indigotica]|uniref:Uncharacterized protein n=1 Tax=Mycena indigotica TaxID=2126181 RepID=A0A8H6S925_9AGAR|nr:uncharacterized protein MIND_00994300 [Mycena indigotica]KAF7294578.1 hypothetical protein MIND_00994300 [Mycena indigotica]
MSSMDSELESSAQSLLLSCTIATSVVGVEKDYIAAFGALQSEYGFPGNFAVSSPSNPTFQDACQDPLGLVPWKPFIQLLKRMSTTVIRLAAKALNDGATLEKELLED